MSGESSGSGRFASPASACLRIGRGQLPAPAARIPESGTADREPARLSPLASGAPEEPPAHQVLLHDDRATAQAGPARPVVHGETPGLFVAFRHGLGAQIGRNRPDHPAVDVVGHGGREVVPQRAQALRGDLASGRQGRDAGSPPGRCCPVPLRSTGRGPAGRRLPAATGWRRRSVRGPRGRCGRDRARAWPGLRELPGRRALRSAQGPSSLRRGLPPPAAGGPWRPARVRLLRCRRRAVPHRRRPWREGPRTTSVRTGRGGRGARRGRRRRVRARRWRPRSRRKA